MIGRLERWWGRTKRCFAPHSILVLIVVLPILGQEPRFEERMEVERIIVDAFITDPKGNPVEGLTAEDLDVRIGGERAEIEAVDWIPVEQRFVSPEPGAPPMIVRNGRLIVLFFQTDFARNQARVRGQMAVIPQAKRFLGVLNPSDLVAIVQFDSHLRVRCDFTTDRDVLETIIERSLYIERADPIESDEDVSLLDHIDLDAAKRAANVEKALWIVARALNEIHGAKSLIMYGFGLGLDTKGNVSVLSDYRLARDMLAMARTTVFAIDITEADYHTLEVGMQTVAGDTGGFYAKTYHFPSIAFERLANTLSGRYEIVLKRPDVRPGRHAVSVRVNRPEAYHVQVPATIIVR